MSNHPQDCNCFNGRIIDQVTKDINFYILERFEMHLKPNITIIANQHTSQDHHVFLFLFDIIIFFWSANLLLAGQGMHLAFMVLHLEEEKAAHSGVQWAALSMWNGFRIQPNVGTEMTLPSPTRRPQGPVSHNSAV